MELQFTEGKNLKSNEFISFSPLKQELIMKNQGNKKSGAGKKYFC